MTWFLVIPSSTISLAIVAAVLATGQSYVERGYVHANQGLEDDEEDFITPYYDWNNDGPEIWRWNVEDFPHPQLEPRFCQRMGPSNVCDPDQILTKTEADSLDSSIRKLFNETPCICEKCAPSSQGIQIGIAILRHTYKPYNEMPSKIIQSFAKNLRSKWRLGDCDDDILIVVATDDRQSYTDVGRATSRFISQEEAYRIFLENKAHFSGGKYYDGLNDMLRDYRAATRKIAKESKEPEVKVGSIIGIAIGTLLLLAVLSLIGIWIYKKCKCDRSSRTSSGNGGDTISSTWRRKMHLSPIHISSRDTYKACKTEDVPVPEEDNTLVTELASPERTADVNITDRNSDHISNEGAVSADVGNPPSDNDTKEKQNPLLTFAPKKPTELHQTDL